MSLSYQQQAQRDGYQHGVNDATCIEWTDATANAFLEDDTDAITPLPPLSGEHAGGLVPEDLREHYGVSGVDDEDAYWQLDKVCDAYEAGYNEGWYDRAHEGAKAHFAPTQVNS